jgi:hypothetical protein
MQEKARERRVRSRDLRKGACVAEWIRQRTRD